MNDVEESVDPRLWHASAGGMIPMLLPDSYVYYFPQGHAEQTHAIVEFTQIPTRVSPCILCKVIDVKFLVHLEQEEVYAKIRLSPVKDDERSLADSPDIVSDKFSYFAKMLTRTCATAGFLSVPKDKAEMMFPELRYPIDPSGETNIQTISQTIIAKDIHGKNWEFKHVCRGEERRHTLTSGWKAFAKEKKLVEGNMVVFTHAENGDLCVGIIRANSSGTGRVRLKDVTEAASLAVNGQEFEVTYYPRANSPEFVVKASSVKAADRAQWKDGMRVLMTETKDLLKKYWLMGNLSSVGDADPLHWPTSPWRCLQVKWDGSQHETRVSPWLVEVVPIEPSRKLNKKTDQRVNHPSGSNANICEVFLEDDDYLYATLDLYATASYGEVQKALKDMFGIEKFDDSTYVVYTDPAGVTKRMCEEPYSEFAKTKMLTVIGDVRDPEE